MSEIDNVLEKLNEAKNSLEENSRDSIENVFRRNPVLTVDELLQYAGNDAVYDVLKDAQVVVVLPEPLEDFSW